MASPALTPGFHQWVQELPPRLTPIDLITAANNSHINNSGVELGPYGLYVPHSPKDAEEALFLLVYHVCVVSSSSAT